jgi:tRNA nucleotidyltransferase (CCA-adding enzyme)
MTDVALFAVGGSVRDELLGLPTKDYDFTAVVSDVDTVEAAWCALNFYLDDHGFEVFLSTPKFFTLRARFPVGHEYAGMTADFVLARTEGPYSDGRHPDWVAPGTLLDDLARRDFTVNAIARDLKGNIIDPFDGQRDLQEGLLRAVGDVETRFSEDALRALRAVRFSVTKGLTLHGAVEAALASEWLPGLLRKVSVERRRAELLTALRHDALATMDLLYSLPPSFREAVFSDGLWLKPTLEK